MQSVGAARSVAVPKLPASHSSGVLALGGQYEPGRHAMQPVAPSELWYVPPAHDVHEARWFLLEYVPALHGISAVAPTGQ